MPIDKKIFVKTIGENIVAITDPKNNSSYNIIHEQNVIKLHEPKNNRIETEIQTVDWKLPSRV